MNNGLLTRSLSAVGIIVVTVLFTYLGGIPLLIETFFIGYVGLNEFYRAVGVVDKSWTKEPVAIMAVISTILYYVLSYFLGLSGALFMVLIGVIFILCVYVFTFPRYKSSQIAYAIMGFIYVPVMVSFIYFTRTTDKGIYLTWLIYGASWACDTGAYLVGMSIGKHRLAPVLSPKKSIEGAIGGVVVAAICGAVYAFVLMRLNIFDFGAIWRFALVCGVGGMISQVGDLAASAVKRDRDIKDYGKLIPGHGGILDRFDSTIFAAPIVFFLILLVNGR